MNEERALELIESVVEKTTGEKLDTKARTIIIGTWRGLSYRKIAIELERSDGYVGSDVAPKIWTLIERSLFDIGIKESVQKKTLKAVIERNYAEIIRQLALEQKNTSRVFKSEVSSQSQPTAITTQVKGLELPDGPLSIGSNFYVEREEIAKDCYSEIQQPGGLIRIKGPNQTGKTSLIIRILEFARQKEYKTAYFNFQDDADRSSFSNLEEFLKWFCVIISESLSLPEETEKYWQGMRGGHKVKCRRYFERYLLQNIEGSLVLAIDEINCIFGQEVETDFFSLLRTLHEFSKRGQKTELWKRLRMVLSYSTEAYSVSNINQSPFNVGFPVALSDFKESEVIGLARKYGLNLNSLEIKKIISQIGTHPYLVQKAFYHLAKQKMTVADLLEKAHTEEGIYGFHLRRHLTNLEKQSELFSALKLVLKTPQPVQLEAVERFKLSGMGIVNLEGNKVKIRSEIYQKYFQEVLP